MRELTDHKVNPANDTIKIEVADQPGSGNACHEYDVVLPNGQITRISFQNGPIGEAGVNGLTQEVLLTIVIDRLRGFQGGQYASRQNAIALTKIEEAMHWLHSRTKDRMARGVEGTHAA